MSFSCNICFPKKSSGSFHIVTNPNRIKCRCNSEQWHESCLAEVIAQKRGVLCTACNHKFSVHKVTLFTRFLRTWLYETPLWPPTFFRATMPKNTQLGLVALKGLIATLYVVYALLLCVAIGSYLEALASTWYSVPEIEEISPFTKALLVPTGAIYVQQKLYHSVVHSTTMTSTARLSRIFTWIFLANGMFKALYLAVIIHIRFGHVALHYYRRFLLPTSTKTPTANAPSLFRDDKRPRFVFVQVLE
jgi:hypothetical protein